MAKTSFVVTRKPKAPKLQMIDYRKEVAKDLKPVADKHVKKRNEVVSNWSNKPTFSSKVVLTDKLVALEVTVTESDPSKPLWEWLDETGTKAHVITPKPDNPLGRLFFLSGTYVPKTGANPARWGGLGQVQGGSLVSPFLVNHPGFSPRKFSEKINKDLNPDFQRAVNNGGRRGLRKAKKR